MTRHYVEAVMAQWFDPPPPKQTVVVRSADFFGIYVRKLIFREVFGEG